MHVYNLLFGYGAFLMACGIMAVVLIGLKAKTALASGGISGIIALTIGFYLREPNPSIQIISIIFPLLLFGVFAWRSYKSLLNVLSLAVTKHPDVAGKTIAFLIISLMAVVSIMVALIQLLFLAS